jgi:Acetyltransferases
MAHSSASVDQVKEPPTGSIPLQEQLAKWHPISLDDAEYVHELIARCEEVDNPPFRTTLSEVRDWLSSDGGWAGTLGVAAYGPLAGEPVCYALVMIVGGSRDCIARGGVAPGYRGRGLGAAVVDWQIKQGTQLLQDVSGRILTHVSDDQEELQRHLVRMGFKWVHTSHELRRSLVDVPQVPELPWGFALCPWDDQWDMQARRIYSRLMENGATSSDWSEGRDSVRPEWSFVALDKAGDRPDLVGFIRVSAYPDDWETLGWREGYIDLLGVETTQAGHVLSRALVISSMNAMAEHGMSKVAAGVGVASNESALDFYEDLGFERSFQTRTYSFDV